MKGTFIVIDGIDGTGKATQTKLISEKIKALGREVATIDFPRYNNNFFGKLIGECLRGDCGDFIGVHPKIASVLYACDRMESAKQINEWLESGTVIVADRYVSSNQIHQGGKCKTDDERREFLNWLDTMEHEVLEVPRPDLIIYLNMPVEASLSLIKKRENNIHSQKNRSYLKDKRDQAESNLSHLEKSRMNAMKIIGEKNNWIAIDCWENGELLSIDEIHRRIEDIVHEHTSIFSPQCLEVLSSS